MKRLQRISARAFFLNILILLTLLSPGVSVAQAVPSDTPTGTASALDSDYLAVMFSKSLGEDFGGYSPDLTLAKGYAYNQCLRYADSHRDVYRNDCNRGLWVRNGYIAIYISGPFDGPAPYAWGFGWARTLEQAEGNALEYCREFGGDSCSQKRWWNNVSDLSRQPPTTGGNW
jgi:hypothetical protein